MAAEMKLPELGENVETGFVVKLLVSPGDRIEIDQPVMELETEKATVEVPSSVAGIIKEIRVEEQDEIRVGQVLLTVEESGEAKPKTEEPEAKTTEAAAPKADEKEAEEEPHEEPEEPAETKEAPPRKKEPEPKPSTPTPAPSAKSAAASPSVRTFAREIGVDVSQVTGTGPDGRITMEDVKAFSRQAIQTAAVTGKGMPAPPLLPDFEQWGPVERQPMSNIRRRTAEHLAVAWAQAPHVTQFDRADVTALEQSRKRFTGKVEQQGAKLTVTAIITKVAASALSAFPQFKASLDVVAGEIVLKKYCHIGIAVDTERGLIVPVIRDADKRNIVEIAAALTDLAERTRDGKVRLEELQGGVFTITNLGGIGGTHFSPIVNYPEVAILGVGRAYEELRLVEGEIEPRLILPLALSYDHRVIDGADGARFLHWIVEALEQPLKLSIEG